MRKYSFSYKNGIIFLLFITLILCVLEEIIIWNEKYIEKYSEKDVEELIFSHESGFYEEEFDLTISARDGGIIYYTLDGSDPDEHSILYEGPIHIEDPTDNENVYASIEDVSTGFYKDKIEEYSPDLRYMGYVAPDYKVDKACIVRAVVYYDWFHKSEIATNTYFVGFSEKEGYEGMNILSLVTDPENMFGYEKGIYVTGKTFADYWEDRVKLDEPGWIDKSWIWWPANYRNKGKEWEREGYCQFFDANGNLLTERGCGIRIHGGYTRGQNPRSLNLYAREAYGDGEVFDYNFFEADYYPSSLTVSQGGNDNRAKVVDSLFSQAVEELEFAHLDYVPYVMFLDGEYWGVYWLCEKYDPAYLAYHYDVLAENTIIIKNGQLASGDSEGQRLYDNMLEIGQNADLTQEDNWDKICDLIDVESYIDYYASLIYVGRNDDWPNGNFSLWRTHGIDEASPYSDGKWRWMAFDLNSGGLEEKIVDMDTIGYVMKKNEMFNNMMTNDTFRQAFLQRIQEMGDTVFTTDKVNLLLEKHREQMDVPLIYDRKRYCGTQLDGAANAYINKIEDVRAFFEKRNDVIKQLVEKYSMK